MYTTIEADIENGIVRSPEASKIPAHAHVLITLLPPSREGTKASAEPGVSIIGPARRPHPDIRGKIKVLGDIMSTVPASSWNLPS